MSSIPQWAVALVYSTPRGNGQDDLSANLTLISCRTKDFAVDQAKMMLIQKNRRAKVLQSLVIPTGEHIVPEFTYKDGGGI